MKFVGCKIWFDGFGVLLWVRLRSSAVTTHAHFNVFWSGEITRVEWSFRVCIKTLVFIFCVLHRIRDLFFAFDFFVTCCFSNKVAEPSIIFPISNLVYLILQMMNVNMWSN